LLVILENNFALLGPMNVKFKKSSSIPKFQTASGAHPALC